MEHVLNKFQRLIAKLLFLGWGLSVAFVYAFLENPQVNKYIAIYISIWGFYAVEYLYEHLLSDRIQREAVTKIYTPSYKLLVLELIGIVLLHSLFWYAVAKENFSLIILVTTLIPSVIPRRVKSSIFDCDLHIVCDGVKYYYEQIEDFKAEHAYRIELTVSGKKVTINCGSAKVYDIVLKTLENHICKTKHIPKYGT